MKTPDEIKKGLECHTSDDIVSCYDCPYYYDCYETARSNGAVMAMDTIAYTRQLEAKVSELEKRCDAAQINASHAISELATVRNQCIKAIENVIKATPKWISVEERLPVDDGKYIVCTAKGSVYCTKFSRHSFHTDMNTHVTHWMPLPDPPEDNTK